MCATRLSPLLALALLTCGLCGVRGAAAQDAASEPLKQPLFQVRGGLDHCRLQFLREKQGRVAFLGGSITAQTGWRDLTCEQLKQRFPDTQFEFINAGVGGTNSTLGAFRLEQDVFKNGPVDLLFVEYAVNDGNSESADNRQTRALEGIVRHARRLNPGIDLVIQYFTDTDKVEELRKGTMPEVIVRHDRIAGHYGIPCINMAVEMTRRMDAKEFTWEQFSNDTCHPSKFGHERYAECIEKFLDAAWSKAADPSAQPRDHALPEPLDRLNYEQGRFVALDQAKSVNGWIRNKAWDTEKKCNYGGAVDVFAAEQPGALLELEFIGSVAGLYAIAGMDAGILEISLDHGPFKPLDLFDGYCSSFHRPVFRVLVEELTPGKHLLQLRMSQDKNPKSLGHAARILYFAVN